MHLLLRGGVCNGGGESTEGGVAGCWFLAAAQFVMMGILPATPIPASRGLSGGEARRCIGKQATGNT